jgi:putative oxidoreductase
MASLAPTLLALRQRLLDLARRLQFLAPLLLRLTVGVVFIGTGWGKLHSLGDVTQFFADLHIPAPALQARVVASLEFFGGILVVLGLGTRLVAIPLAFTMVVAIATAKWGDVSDVFDFVGLDEWAYLVIYVVLAIIGPGALSLDALLARRLERERALGARP